jgi:hypothetical protein
MAMHFSAEQIELAHQLKAAGLAWQPAVGHYVHDPTELIEQPSPFQERVYFILDLKHFLRRAGTVAVLAERLVWLPQWHQVRGLLAEQGVSDATVQARLVESTALLRGKELTDLYRLLLERLQNA